MRERRFTELDALRAFAVVLVVWAHTSDIKIGIGGYHGVTLFFIISGFLITRILLDARDKAAQVRAQPWAVLLAFYARRFLRIFPVYYVVLLGAFILGLPSVRSAIGWHLAYLSNWYFAFRDEFDTSTAHLWSLAVEEQFYLLWPWLVLLLRPGALPWAIGTMILIGPVSRYLIGSGNLGSWIATPTALDAIGFGCLLAYIWHITGSGDRIARWALLCSVSLFVLAERLPDLGFSGDAAWAVDYLGWELLFVWLVHRAARGVRGPIGKLLRMQPIVYLGTISYGCYLIHHFVMPIVHKVEYRLGVDLPIPKYYGVGQFVVVMLITVLAAALSWEFFEKPINSLKRRFPYVVLALPRDTSSEYLLKNATPRHGPAES